MRVVVHRARTKFIFCGRAPIEQNRSRFGKKTTQEFFLLNVNGV